MFNRLYQNCILYVSFNESQSMILRLLPLNPLITKTHCTNVSMSLSFSLSLSCRQDSDGLTNYCDIQASAFLPSPPSPQPHPLALAASGLGPTLGKFIEVKCNQIRWRTC